MENDSTIWNDITGEEETMCDYYLWHPDWNKVKKGQKFSRGWVDLNRQTLFLPQPTMCIRCPDDPKPPEF